LTRLFYFHSDDAHAGMPASAAHRTRPAHLPPFPRLSELPWARIASVLIVIAVLAIALYRQIDMEAVHAYAARLNGAVAFALLTVLPLLGFPASVLHVAAGIRFGAALGLALVSLSILIQLLASYALVRVWRPHFERARWLRKLRARIPEGAHASVSVFTVLLPGAPYAAINYVLPLVGVPLRTFVLCAWPLHTLRSTITVALGHHSAHLTVTRLVVLIAYALTILGASWWMYHRLQSQFSGRPPAAGDRKPRA
jgi:uncharacterized membrane protein YdjX (TVP38/TMEM64 family)